MNTGREDGETLPAEVQQLVAALQQRGEEQADERLLARIQASRASGVRVLVPAHVVDTDTSMDLERVWTRARAAVLIAGAAAFALIALFPPTRAVSTAASPSSTAPVSAAPSVEGSGGASAPSGMAELLSPWPRVAYAQQPAGGRAGPLPAISGLNADRVVPGVRSYVRLSSNAYHDALPHELYEMAVDTVRLGNRRMLRSITTTIAPRALNGSARTDTLWLERATFRPVRRRADLGFVRVEQDFTDSTLTERVSLVESRLTKRERGSLFVPRHLRNRTITIDPSRLFVVSESMLRVVLSALPLTAGWRGSIGVLEGDSRLFAMGPSGYRNVHVAGIDTVQTFSGRIEAWRVELQSGGEPERWSVSRETGETLLTQGPFDVSYPESRSWLVGGFREMNRLVPVRRTR